MRKAFPLIIFIFPVDYARILNTFTHYNATMSQENRIKPFTTHVSGSTSLYLPDAYVRRLKNVPRPVYALEFKHVNLPPPHKSPHFDNRNPFTSVIQNTHLNKRSQNVASAEKMVYICKSAGKRHKNHLQRDCNTNVRQMKDRIRQIMKSKNMTQQEFANYVGMSPAALSSIFNERTKPTLNTVEAIKGKMPDISINWLMFGKGDMYESGGGTADVGGLAEGAPAASPTAPATGGGETGAQSRGGGMAAADDGRALGISSQNAHNATQAKSLVMKYIDNPQRKITEIRVFFDDQTYESFVPRKQ